MQNWSEFYELTFFRAAAIKHHVFLLISGSLDLENYRVKVLLIWHYDKDTFSKPNRRISGLCLALTIPLEHPHTSNPGATR